MRLVKDRVVQYPHRYKLTKVDGTDDVYDLERVPGTVSDEGTAVNRQLFNSIDSALLCTHSKTGTVHTFTLNSDVAAFVPGQTIYTVKAALTASIEYGDTFVITDGATTYDGIVPKTSEGGNYRVTLYQELSPVVIFEVNLGGSAKHAFFRGGGQKRLFREVFTASGSWTCPDFVDEIYVQAFGGGGGGGGGANNIQIGSVYNCDGGGGGGGGHMAEGSVRVNPGTEYSFTIGAGGNGGVAADSSVSVSATNGSDGGPTTFISVSAAGGSGGGACSESGLCAGGLGGAGGGYGGESLSSPGTVGASAQFAEAPGRHGGNGYGILSYGGTGSTASGNINGHGGGGGASYGPGGDGAMSKTSSGSDGKYGGGGGGGSNGNGGKGGDGILFISYYADPSMLSDRTPEEFDIQYVTAATVVETVVTNVTSNETADETGGETHETNETINAAEEASETEGNV